MRGLAIILGLLGGLGSGPRPLLAAGPSAAPREDEDEYVRRVVGRAAAHVDAERYDEALAVLDEAERERPLPVFVYVRATIEERRGSCERAAELYREFLEHEVPEADAEEARRGVLRCRPELGGDAPGREVSTGAEASTPEEPERPPRPWSADPLGASLVIAGVAGMGVGLGLYAQSRADERAARSASTLQTFEDASRRAVALNRAGIATLVVGSALLAGGAVRYAIVGTRARRRARATAAWIPGQLSVGVHMRF